MSPYRDLAADVSARLVALIEAGAGTWQMPWHASPDVLDVRNVVTGARYNGTNWATLICTAFDEGWSPWWATYRQWSDVGGQVRRGETGARIVKWVPARGNDAEADEVRGRRLVPRVYTVFNAAQVDGWTPPAPRPRLPMERDARADAWIAATGADISYGYCRACYRPAVDRIELPAPEAFDDRECFYGTVLHDPLTAPSGVR
jgi:antirestriction protein ArdC